VINLSLLLLNWKVLMDWVWNYLMLITNARNKSPIPVKSSDAEILLWLVNGLLMSLKEMLPKISKSDPNMKLIWISLLMETLKIKLWSDTMLTLILNNWDGLDLTDLVMERLTQIWVHMHGTWLKVESRTWSHRFHSMMLSVLTLFTMKTPLLLDKTLLHQTDSFYLH